MNVRGVIFKTKLQWAPQISQTITKALKIIMTHLNINEPRQLLTANYYSFIYYNSEIWHILSLKLYLKQQLLSASEAGLWLCTAGDTCMNSCNNLHTINKRATLD